MITAGSKLTSIEMFKAAFDEGFCLKLVEKNDLTVIGLSEAEMDALSLRPRSWIDVTYVNRVDEECRFRNLIELNQLNRGFYSCEIFAAPMPEYELWKQVRQYDPWGLSFIIS